MIAELYSAVAVKTEVVKSGSYSTDFTSTGMLAACCDLTFVSDVTGRIVKINVSEGDFVKKGQAILQLDDEMLRADFISVEAAYEGLKKDYERFKNSSEQGGVTEQQLDNMHTQMIAAESRYITSKRRLADATVKVPISGTIYKKYVEVGGYLNPGAKLFDIIDDTQLKIMCFVTEKQLLGIRKGQEVKVTTETFPTEVFSGKISFISSKADHSLNFPVEIMISNKNKELRSGMLVTAHFINDIPKSGITIPRSAISGSIHQANVFVVRHGAAYKQSVTTGNILGERIEILKGLQTGDSIITAGLINITDGTKVKIVD